MRPLAGIQRQRDFQRLLRRGRRYRGQFLTLVVLIAAVPEPLRAVSITNRKVGGAVVRNRLKRRFREILRHADWCEDAAGDLAVIAHPPAAGAGYADLEQELSRALCQAGLTAESV